MADSRDLHERVKQFVRAFGLHQPDQTPCGVQIAVSDAHALTEIADHPFLTQRELSERLSLEKSTVSRLIDKLEWRGWVVRQLNDSDRRVATLALTEKGRAVAREITAARANKFNQVLSRIPPSEREHVMNSLDTLIGAMTEKSEGTLAGLEDAHGSAHGGVAGDELHERRRKQ